MQVLLVISILSWFNWKTLKTDNFTVYYKPGYEWEAMQALQNLELYRDRAIDITGNTLGNTAVVVEDVGDLPSGFANPVFRDIHLFTHPPQGGQMDMTQNWYRAVGFHEYVHMAHMRKTSGMAKLFADAFGTIFQPNMYSPGWIIEGITVYGESQLSPYEGRLNDGFFDAYVACRASRNKMPSIADATYTPLEFPYGSGIYLYGGELFDYLGNKYGESSFGDFFRRYGSCPGTPLASCLVPALGIEIAASGVYGRSFPSLFNEWRRAETARSASWKVDGRRRTDAGWFCAHLVASGGKLYYVRDYPKKTDALTVFYFTEIIEHDMSLRDEKVIVRTTSSVSAPIKLRGQYLYYATMELQCGYANVSQGGYGIRSNLYRRDLADGSTKKLFSDAMRAFAPLKDSEIIYSKDRVHAFGSELWCYRGGKREKLGEFDFLIGEIEANGDVVVVSARRDNENWDLFTLDIEKRDLVSMQTTPWSETDISLKNDTLYFTANYDGVYSIYRIDLVSGTLARLTEGGFSRSGVTAGDTLYFIGLNPRGFDVYEKAVAHQPFELGDWPVSPPVDIPELASAPRRGNYLDVAGSFLDPDVRVPVVFPGDSTLKSWYLGAVLVNTDAPNENVAISVFAYDWANEDLILNTSFQSLLFLPAEMSFAYDHGNSTEIRLELPLYRQLNQGLTSVTCGLTAAAWEDSIFARRGLSPYAAVGFDFPGTGLDVYASFPLEREAFGSNVERTAQYVNVSVRQYLAGGEIRPVLRGFNRPDAPSSSQAWIRGDSLRTRTGAILTAEYSHPLLRIRKGLWNPNIYFEDLCGTIFVDGCFSPDGDYTYSAGVELSQEIGVFLGWVKFAPVFGVAVNRDRQFSPYFRLKMGELF